MLTRGLPTGEKSLLPRCGHFGEINRDTAELGARGETLEQASEEYERWSEQTRTLLDACAHISNHLRYTKNQHDADDTHIAGAVSSIATLDEGFDDRKGH